jgi:hypothetical protein
MNELESILGLALLDPLGAAVKLDNLAGRIKALAAKLRDAHTPPGDLGGIGDRVTTVVVGPSGDIKKRTDTGGIA